jgi:hypothetical protein
MRYFLKTFVAFILMFTFCSYASAQALDWANNFKRNEETRLRTPLW